MTATRSFTVVISGPDATAGSIFILWKNNGTNVPTRLEIAIAKSNEMPTHPDIRKAALIEYPLNTAT